MALELVIFDLDGVLFDSARLVVESMHAAIERFETETGETLALPSAEQVHGMMGVPNTQYTRQLGYNLTEEGWSLLKDLVLEEEVRLIGEGRGRLNDGVRDLIAWLRGTGICCAIASNCAREYLLAFLEYFELEDHFDMSVCNDDNREGDKSDLLEMVMERLEVLPSESIYLGDRGFDETAARKAGTGFLGCLWGFGRREDFSEGALLCETPAEIQAALRNLVPPVH